MPILLTAHVPYWLTRMTAAGPRPALYIRKARGMGRGVFAGRKVERLRLWFDAEVVFRALRDIAVGEQILIDYGWEDDDYANLLRPPE